MRKRARGPKAKSTVLTRNEIDFTQAMQDLSTEGSPSNLALKHESDIATLKTGMNGIANELQDTRTWMQRMERVVEEMASNLAAQITKVSDRMTNKNPMVYIGLGSLTLTIIGIASALTIFTINAQIRPLETQAEMIQRDKEQADARWQTNYEMSIRNDERLKQLEKVQERADRLK